MNEGDEKGSGEPNKPPGRGFGRGSRGRGSRGGGGFRSGGGRRGGGDGGRGRGSYRADKRDTGVRGGSKHVDRLFEKTNNTGINFAKYEDIPVNVEGRNPPKPFQTVEQANLTSVLNENLSKAGYTSFTPVQKHSLPVILSNRDLLACAQTGSGKTAAFLLPIVNNLLSDPSPKLPGVKQCHQPQCVIVTPTRELAIQIYDEARKFSYGSDLKCGLAYGGVSTGSQLGNLTDGFNILVATPGRLLDFVSQKKIGFGSVRYLVLDEADRMLDMGFMPDVKKMVNDPSMPPKGERVTLMFSATFPEPIRRAAEDFLSNYLYLSVGVVGGACQDVKQNFHQVQRRDKKPRLVNLLTEIGDGKILVFLRTKHKTHKLSQQLSRDGFRCGSIHGDRSQGQREQALAEFSAGVSNILVATAVVARGLDIPDVTHVVNFDMPGDVEEYVHRIGRTGRVGNNGMATSFFDFEDDWKIQKDLVRILSECGQIVPDWLAVDQMDKYKNSEKNKKSNVIQRDREERRRDKLEKKTLQDSEQKCEIKSRPGESSKQHDQKRVQRNVVESRSDESQTSQAFQKALESNIQNGSQEKVETLDVNGEITDNSNTEKTSKKRNRKRNKKKSPPSTEVVVNGTLEGANNVEENQIDNSEKIINEDKPVRKRNRPRGKRDGSVKQTNQEEEQKVSVSDKTNISSDQNVKKFNQQGHQDKQMVNQHPRQEYHGGRQEYQRRKNDYQENPQGRRNQFKGDQQSDTFDRNQRSSHQHSNTREWNNSRQKSLPEFPHGARNSKSYEGRQDRGGQGGRQGFDPVEQSRVQGHSNSNYSHEHHDGGSRRSNSSMEFQRRVPSGDNEPPRGGRKNIGYDEQIKSRPAKSQDIREQHRSDKRVTPPQENFRRDERDTPPQEEHRRDKRETPPQEQHRRETPPRAVNNPMAADIVGILNQQARGESGAGGGRQPNYPVQDRPLNEYRGGSGGPRERLYGGQVNQSPMVEGGVHNRGSRDAVTAPVSSEVADLASLMELKARLAQEQKEKVSVRNAGRTQRQNTARDLANTSHWPAL